MIARRLGATGIVVPALGLGCGALGDDADRLLSTALDLGVTLLDTAPSYGDSEERIGRWLAADPGRRARVVLSTKGGYGVPGVPDWTGECIARGVDAALARLRTDVIDVFHLHSCDLQILERGDVVGALEDAVKAGKIRVAAYSGENEALAWAIASGRFGAVQCSVNPFDQGALDRLPSVGLIAKRAIGNAPWRFAERPNGHYAEVYWDRMRAMGLGPLEMDGGELALRFTVFAPGVASALVGTSRAEHLADNVRLAARGPLPREVIERIRSAWKRAGAGWVGQI